MINTYFINKISFLLTRKQKRQLLYLTILLFLGMLFEVAGLMILMPIIELMQKVDIASKYPIFKNLYNFLGKPNNSILLFYGLLIMSIFFTLKTLFSIYISWKQSNFPVRVSAELTEKLFNIYLKQPYSFHLKVNSASLINTIQTEVVQFSNALQSIVSLSVEVSMIFAILITLFYIQSIGTFFLVVFFSVTIFFYYALTKNKISHWGKMRLFHSSQISKQLIQSLDCVKEIKLMNKEEYFNNQLNFHNYKNANLLSNVMFFGLIPRNYLELLTIISLSGLITILSTMSMDFYASISILVIFVAAAFRLLPSVNRVISAMQSVRFVKPVVNHLYDEFFILNKNINHEIIKNKKKIFFKESILCENLNFSYETNINTKAIKNVNFNIKKGETVGIIGSSGSGKSTLINLLLGMLYPLDGDIKVDNQSIYEGLNSWQKIIGYVPQSISLTDETLLKNIAFGIESEDIDYDAVSKAVNAAQLDNFINNLELGLETLVGEKGVRISGGQKQRIAIARALYNNPEILILDEATSSLDIETELEFMNSINKLHGTKTIIIVAHRLSTVKLCDRIYKIENGQIIAEGKPNEILIN
jgi:ABC-type multidrug transport system fused ATPase/permease subunit